MRKKNIFLIIVTLILYCVNQLIKTKIPFAHVKWFLACYFNDMVGGITFMAYCGIIFDLFNRKMMNLWEIELLMVGCGCFWEYITPLYRAITVSDPWDILAYAGGGFIYWLVIRSDCK